MAGHAEDLGDDCILSSKIESHLFRPFLDEKQLGFDTPKEDCPICLESLSTAAKLGNPCCGTYARMLYCGHWVHVSCQINRNKDRTRCSICRALFCPNMELIILRHKLLQQVSIHHRAFFNPEGAHTIKKEDVQKATGWPDSIFQFLAMFTHCKHLVILSKETDMK
jgi:hypothetical protein